ncbi:hypothetical protein KC19_6G072500 [Ceratodon purpureus]|uniref:Uncharacterized protein n=1 Tax=Ceratodon purpureus TaxID=3225 RepID=A0A8T0HGJ7_CERPU|nr:hypothetical protein KC19_6G072500 [Ceratodon purpureus]
MKLSKQVAGLGLLLVLVITLSPAPVLGCVDYGQPCGPFYHCCDCLNGRVMSCEFWEGAFKCAVVAYCDSTEGMTKAFGLPRKMKTSLIKSAEPA